jgi:hypothetical protein
MRTSLRLFMILGLLVPAMAQAASMSFDEYAERRRGVIEEQVMLSDAVADDFWRLYDEYTMETASFFAQRAALHGAAGSEDDVDDMLDIEEELYDARKSFVRQLRRADVPDSTIMQFLMIEQRLDAVYTINEG